MLKNTEERVIIMLKTRMTKLLGIQYPIMQGGMQHLGVPPLAAAVSNAGGLGTINVTIYPELEEFRDAVREMRHLTSKPFAVNVSAIPNLDVGERTAQYITAAAEEGVKVLETSGLDLKKYRPMIKECGLIHIHKVPAARHAATAERLGVDMVTVVGSEAAGHPSPNLVGSLVLTSSAVQKVKIPVLAAGGFTDGCALAAALALGAEGVVMGTRFVASSECRIHNNFKRWIIDATENDTGLCQKSIRNLVRVAKNDAYVHCCELDERGATLEELMTVISGTISKQCYQNGDIHGGMFAIGQGAGLIHSVLPAKEIVEGIVRDAEDRLRRLCALCDKAI